MPDPAGATHVRLLVASTPRSGNTWLRQLLAGALGVEHVAIHHPGELASRPPLSAVVQLHWQHGADLGGLASWPAVTLVRHPLDVLVSVLHFAQFSSRSSLWLLGSGGNEERLLGRHPNHEDVIAYARGERFRRLLEVSTSWRPHASVVVYEDLVADPHGTLRTLLSDLRLPAVELDGPVAANRIELMRRRNPIHHPRGRPDAWRSYLTQATADSVAAVIPDVLRSGGYDTRADPDLDVVGATRQWEAGLRGVDAPPLLDAAVRLGSVVAYARELGTDLLRGERAGLPAALRASSDGH